MNTASKFSLQNVDLTLLFRDVLKQWKTILLLVLAAGMITHVVQWARFSPTYSTTTTMFVSSSGTTNTVYNNTNATSALAETLSRLLSNHILQDAVAKEAGLDSFSGTASVSMIGESNLVTLKVTADSPEMAFTEMRALLDNYDVVAGDVLGRVVAEELESPAVPTQPDQTLHTGSMVRRVMLVTLLLLVVFFGHLSLNRDTIRTRTDIRNKLQIPVLGQIRHTNKYHSLSERIRKVKKSILITDPTTGFDYVESIGKITTQLQQKAEAQGAKSIMITSVLENEGKSTLAANIALELSRQGHWVMLIDADFRKPSQYKVLNLMKESFTDLTDVIAEGRMDFENVLLRLRDSKLLCVLNRKTISRELIVANTDRLKWFIDQMKPRMEYIIVDSSPMGVSGDSEELSTCVDAAVLVIKQHQTEVSDLQDSIDALNAGGDKVIGCVLNDVRTAPTTYGSKYGYGYGYRYGYGYGYGGKHE